MFCRNCGKELTGTPEFGMNCGAKPMPGTNFCPDFGAQTTPLTKVCTNCGAQVSKTIKGETWKPTAAGILYIIAGVIGLISGIVVAAAGGIGGAFIGMAWLSAVSAPLTILGTSACRVYLCTPWPLGTSRDTGHCVSELGEA
jgi:hypothetical protein